MKVLLLSITTIAMTWSNISLVNASQLPQHISAQEVSTNIFTITQNSIIDNVIFDEMSYLSEVGNWFTNSVWWQSTSGQIDIDLGDSFIIQDILIQVDYDDSYHLDYSIDNLNWSNLFTITPEDGEITWGMDTMSSHKQHNEYVANIDFSAIEARYLRVSASGGNGVYYLSELQAFGTPAPNTIQIQSQNISPVPAPPSVMLFGAGLTMLMGLQYRRKKQKNNSVTL